MSVLELVNAHTRVCVCDEVRVRQRVQTHRALLGKQHASPGRQHASRPLTDGRPDAAASSWRSLQSAAAFASRVQLQALSELPRQDGPKITLFWLHSPPVSHRAPRALRLRMRQRALRRFVTFTGAQCAMRALSKKVKMTSNARRTREAIFDRTHTLTGSFVCVLGHICCRDASSGNLRQNDCARRTERRIRYASCNYDNKRSLRHRTSWCENTVNLGDNFNLGLWICVAGSNLDNFNLGLWICVAGSNLDTSRVASVTRFEDVASTHVPTQRHLTCRVTLGKRVLCRTRYNGEEPTGVLELAAASSS